MPNIRRERVEIDALYKLINDIDNYNNEVEIRINVMNKMTADMQSVWNDPQYNEFKDIMTDILKDLKKDLEKMRETRASLYKMHKIMTE